MSLVGMQAVGLNIQQVIDQVNGAGCCCKSPCGHERQLQSGRAPRLASKEGRRDHKSVLGPLAGSHGTKQLVELALQGGSQCGPAHHATVILDKSNADVIKGRAAIKLIVFEGLRVGGAWRKAEDLPLG